MENKELIEEIVRVFLSCVFGIIIFISLTERIPSIWKTHKKYKILWLLLFSTGVELGIISFMIYLLVAIVKAGLN